MIKTKYQTRNIIPAINGGKCVDSDTKRYVKTTNCPRGLYYW